MHIISVLVLKGIIDVVLSQYECGLSCLCYDDNLDCSHNDWEIMPDLRDGIRYNTVHMYLRYMPNLDLSQFDCSDWFYLSTIDLEGTVAMQFLHTLCFFFYVSFSFSPNKRKIVRNADINSVYRND